MVVAASPSFSSALFIPSASSVSLKMFTFLDPQMVAREVERVSYLPNPVVGEVLQEGRTGDDNAFRCGHGKTGPSTLVTNNFWLRGSFCTVDQQSSGKQVVIAKFKAPCCNIHNLISHVTSCVDPQ